MWADSVHVASALLLALASPGVAAAQVTPVIHRSDYAACNGSGDDAPGIQAAINHALSVGGELDMGSGHCLLGSTVYVRDPSLANNAITLNVRGAGPGNLVLQVLQRGYPLMNVQNLQHSEFGGMKFSGGTGDDRGDTDTRNIGLVIGNGTEALGSFGNRFYEMQFEGFWTGLSIGDINTNGSAAESEFENIGASGNRVGILYATFNSLDVDFRQLNLGNNAIGFYSDSAYTARFENGAGANNGWTFMFNGACCQWIIEGWREEYGADTQGWIAYGSAAANDQLIIIGSNTVDSLNPHRAFPVSIHALTSNAQLLVIGSMLNGAVEGKYVDLLQVAFTNGNAVSGTPAKLAIAQSCTADINNGQCAFDIPDQGSGLYVSPLPNRSSPATATPVATSTAVPTASRTPTATPSATATPRATSSPTSTPPVIATPTATPVGLPVRWDAHGSLSTTAPYQFAYLPLTVTNTSATAWPVGQVTIGYFWTDNNGAYLSSDEDALTGDVQPGGTLSIDIGVVTPPPGTATLHLAMHRSGSQFGTTLDLPEVIR